jgi:hypothetical protein
MVSYKSLFRGNDLNSSIQVSYPLTKLLDLSYRVGHEL